MGDLYKNEICRESFIYDLGRKSILIIYPYKFKYEKILQDNIIKMKEVVIEYINEILLLNYYIDAINKTIWDSKKELLRKEEDEHERKISELSETMNYGISPYKWYFKEIEIINKCNRDSVFFDHDYAIILDKKDKEDRIYYD